LYFNNLNVYVPLQKMMFSRT